MTSSFKCKTSLIAVLLLILPAACGILLSVSQMQMAAQDARALKPMPDIEAVALTNWHFNVLTGSGMLCSLFICGYAVLNLPQRGKKTCANRKMGENSIWNTGLIQALTAAFLITASQETIVNQLI